MRVKGGGMKKDLDSYLLTKKEHMIMNIIWQRDCTTVKEVCNILSQRKVMPYTTVLTFMQILERKGVLSRKLVGRTHQYRPALSRSQATRNHLKDLLDRYFEGNPNKLITTVLEKEL